MNRDELLGVVGMEECNELAQRISKALRFGRDQIQPGQELTNRERVKHELNDLIAILDMLDLFEPDDWLQEQKRAKAERYLDLSIKCGTVEDPKQSRRPIIDNHPICINCNHTHYYDMEDDSGDMEQNPTGACRQGCGCRKPMYRRGQ